MNYPDIYYIKIKNGVPDGFPFLLDNLLTCGIDPRNNSDWMLFIPNKNIPLDDNSVPLFKIIDRKYAIDKDQVVEIWVHRDMTDEEKNNVEATKVLAKFTGNAPESLM